MPKRRDYDCTYEKGRSKMSTLHLQEDALMKLKIIGYWATTAIVTLELLAGGVTDLVHGREVLVVGQPVVLVVAQLGYPLYLLTILGVGRLLRTRRVAITRVPSGSSSSPLSSSLRGRVDRQAGPSASSFRPAY